VKRTIPLLLAGVVAAGAIAGCGDDSGSSASSSAVATVNGTDISNQELVDELEAIEGNTAYVDALEEQASAQQQAPIVASEGEFSTSFVSDTLSVRIQYALVADEVAERDLVASEACVDEATAQLAERYAGVSPDGDGEAVLDAFGDDYRQYLIDRQADFLVLSADIAGKECGAVPTDEEVQAYFDAHPEVVQETACVSHILVETPEEAADIEAQLDAGADFAQLATERSIDTGSGAQGGELGCNPPGQYVQEFEDAVFSQPVGEVGDPVQSEFGYHIILVTERGAPTFEEARPDIEAAMQEQDQQAFLDWFEDALAEGEVTVDPRFGTWDSANGAITPPSVEVTDSGEE
jgi:parvulin-like peptidyl-prolyl isomerase